MTNPLHPYAGITVGCVGNFEPAHSTENELRRALEMLGVDVRCYQEGDSAAWQHLADTADEHDAVIWTRTRSLLERIPADMRIAAVTAIKSADVPLVGYHLDIWWGLQRGWEVTPAAAYFGEVDVMCTADGGHDDDWANIGITHWWFPPAVSVLEAQHGTPRPDVYGQKPVCFVGSWQGGYHAEAQHRHELVAHLKRRSDVEFYPKAGHHAVRGRALADVYATHTVAVGDSALLTPRYYSDRIPETLGRGGCLLHPYVDDVITYGDGPGLFAPGIHLAAFEPGNFDELDDIIDALVADPDQARLIGRAGRREVVENHTYTSRMAVLLERLEIVPPPTLRAVS